MREISGDEGAPLAKKPGNSRRLVMALICCLIGAGALFYFWNSHAKIRELQKELSKLAALAGDEPNDLYLMAEKLEGAGLSHDRILEIYRTLFSAMQQVRKELSAQEQQLEKLAFRLNGSTDTKGLKALTGASEAERVLSKGLNEMLAHFIKRSRGKEKDPEFFQELASVIGPSSHEELLRLQGVMLEQSSLEKTK